MLKKYENLLNLDATIAKELFDGVNYPWEVLPLIKDFILKMGPTLSDEYILYKDSVWVHKSVKISEKADINAPVIIGEGTEVRPGAFIRGSAIIGKNCVIGNSTEVKNAIIFDNCQCPHYVKSDKSNVVVKDDGEIATGLRKMSAILGDYSDIGCNSVLCPGTIIGTHTNVYPLTMVRGVIGDWKIVKSMDNIVDKEQR